MGQFGIIKIIPEGKVAIIAHDAGGAEILSSWILCNPTDFITVLDGSAKKIFKDKLDDLFETSLSNAVKRADWVLTGSGWKSCLEYDAIAYSKNKDKRVITFLDHWGNFRERFIRNGVYQFPDKIWVGDKYALEIARKSLPEVAVINQVVNPYFQDIKEELKKYSKPTVTGKTRILYVTEPTSEHALAQEGNERHWGRTEFDALRYFLENIEKICTGGIEVITVRPHPAEKQGKYDYIIDHFEDLPIEINRDQELLQQIAKHHWVVGCNTIPMVIGLMNGNRVLCSIPPNGGPCQLPFEGIQHISSFVSN